MKPQQQIQFTSLIFLLFVSLFLASCDRSAKLPLQNTSDSFAESWGFTLDTIQGDWEEIHLPHTPKIEPLLVNDQFQGDMWYRKDFYVKVQDNQKYFLDFQGVMHEAHVWLNGKLIATHQGGYTPFSIDLTEHISSQNSLLIKVNNEDNPQIPPGKKLAELDFNFYGGIYRNVFLRTTGKVFITDAITEMNDLDAGVVVHFDEVSTEKASGFVRAQVKNETSTEENVFLAIQLKHKDETHEFTSSPISLAANSSHVFQEEIQLENPRLWDIYQPNLYDAKVVLKNKNGEELHTEELRIGVRSFAIKEDGFYLNDELVFLNGTNRHQEYPYIGYALSDEANYRDAYQIKEAGFDIVRLAHYPHSPSFMRACDELGLLTINCISGWQFVGDEVFKQNSFNEIRAMARRDRNHANVAFWEVSLNESEMDDDFMEEANRILKEELSYQNPLTIGWLDHSSYDLFGPARQHAQAPDYWNKYDKDGKKIFIAEYGDWEYYAQNAGLNQTAFADLKEEERTSRQLRGDGQKRLLQQAFNYQEAFNSNLKGKHSIGQANWLMFDYNRGYADDLESSGISDIFRIPKFAYYFYQSQRDLSKFSKASPTLFIANYWNDPEEKSVRIFSNCEEVALYLNDELIAKQLPHTDEFSDHLPHPPFVFEVPTFEKGTLKAVGFINGKEVATHNANTPGKAHSIALEVDYSNKPISTDYVDYVFVRAKILDEKGNLVPDATHQVTFEVEEVEIMGDSEPFAEAGIAIILIKTFPMSKKISIKASAEGIEEGELIVEF